VKDLAAPNAFSLQIASDLHIEFLNALNNGAEIQASLIDYGVGGKFLALLGDIGVVCDSDREDGRLAGMKQYRAFLRAQAKHFDKVIVITGNHEYYRSSVDDVDRRIEEMCAEMPDKLVFLNAKHPSVELMNGQVRVIGATLWTEVPDNEKTRNEVGMSLNDYRRINVGDRLLTPEDTTNFFRADLAAIEKEISEAGRKGQAAIVLSHHSPVRDFGCSNSEFWRSETRSAFATHLRDLFGKQLVAWCYGHTHWPHDMIIDGTRIIANQGGYVRGAPDDALGYNRRFVLNFPVPEAVTEEESGRHRVSQDKRKKKDKQKQKDESTEVAEETSS
jgi:predicted phosphohydrolase